MDTQRFASVWDAISDTPAEAANMKLRSALMIAIKGRIDGAGLTQAQAAQWLGVTQPRISDLKRGRVDLFGLDALVSMATTAGLRVELCIEPAQMAAGCHHDGQKPATSD